ncbi:hypothetical protein BH09PLA1_BH09PLA1_26010 [soil metagenome]
MSAIPCARKVGVQGSDFRDEASDVRSVRLKDEIAREWKRLKKQGASFAYREWWLNRQETIVGMAARQRADLLQGLAFMKETIARDVPSGTWFDDAWGSTDEPPAPGAEFPPGGRATAMVKSRRKTRIGNEGRMSRRLTPAQCVGEEDYIDGLSIDKATYLSCVWPGSISALAIIRIGHLRAREEGA